MRSNFNSDLSNQQTQSWENFASGASTVILAPPDDPEKRSRQSTLCSTNTFLLVCGPSCDSHTLHLLRWPDARPLQSTAAFWTHRPGYSSKSISFIYPAAVLHTASNRQTKQKTVQRLFRNECNTTFREKKIYIVACPFKTQRLGLCPGLWVFNEKTQG